MEAHEKEIRVIVQNELLDILQDAGEALGTKDPTGMGKKALEALSALIRNRQAGLQQDQK
ncbi:MAG TPA: hypothetical protein VGO91_04720 [Pyrinomonadaceae bacterium]|jgi:hypothetical protein|nr:hypothetical protein [Pyrinomonadaceae bacterium]